MQVKQTLLLMLGLSAILSVMAADQQSTNATKTAKAIVSITKPQVEPAYPAVQYKLANKNSRTKAPKDQDKIRRYEGLSSQAWTTIATRQPNGSVFHDAREHEPKFCIFPLEHQPW